MKIAGLVKSTLIDYPGKIAAVVFTQDCNFRCGFCHNPDLIENREQRTAIREDEVLNFLEKRRGVLEGVVVTGGEPTIQADLPEFFKKIKEMGYSVKLDSNGSNPQMLRKLIEENLVDFIAMDIKGSLEKYEEIIGRAQKNTERSGAPHNSEGICARVRKSIQLIMASGLPYEFRTTVLPFFHEISDFEKVGKMIKGAERYAIQGFRDEVVLDKNLEGTKKFRAEDLKEIAGIIGKYVKEVIIRENR